MFRFLFALCLVLCGALSAQQRRASVELDDGTVLQGVVQSMDLATVHLQVGDTVHTLPATRIRSCRFEPMPPPPDQEPLAPPPATVVAKRPARPASVRSGPAPLPIDPTAAEHLPVDLRSRSRWRQRIDDLDTMYAWLVPSAPSQWLSLALVMMTLGSLVVHVSTRVAGLEVAGLGRSAALCGWYLITVLMQLAFVPVHPLSVALMLLLNPALALFWLCSWFGLSRSGAVIAYAVQLGFVVVAYGVLELVTAVLVSIGVSA